jgi:hypothetical protein
MRCDASDRAASHIFHGGGERGACETDGPTVEGVAAADERDEKAGVNERA